MLVRLLIVVAPVLITVFVPYYLGKALEHYPRWVDHQFGQDKGSLWWSGFVFMVLVFVVGTMSWALLWFPLRSITLYVLNG